MGALEEVIADLFGKPEGKTVIAIERFADSIECLVSIFSGDPTCYRVEVAQRILVYDDVTTEGNPTGVKIVCDHVRKMCLATASRTFTPDSVDPQSANKA